MLDIIRQGARSLAVKVIFGIIILVFIFWGVGNFNKAPQHTAAEVNGENISLNDVMREVRANIDNYRRSVPDFSSNVEAQKRFKELIVRELVFSALRRQEAKRLGIFVSRVELGAVISRIGMFHDDQGKFDPERYKLALKNRGLTVAEFQDGYRNTLLEEKLMALVTAGVQVSEAEARTAFNFGLTQRTAQYVLFDAAAYMDKAEVSDADISAWYETNKDSLRLPARVNLDYIELTPTALAASQTVADAEIAAEYAKKADEYSEPAGYRSRQIFLRLPRADASEYKAAKAKADAKMAEIQKKLAGGADFADLAKEYSDDTLTAPTGGEMGFLDLGVLPHNVDAAAMALNPGQVSAPVDSEYGLHLIKLEEKRAATQKPLAEVHDEIKATLAQEKAQAQIPAMQEKAEDALRLGTSFDKIAAALGVPLQHSGLIPRVEAVALLKLHKDAVAALNGVPTGRAAPSPLAAEDGVALVFVKDAKPEEVPALDSVKAEIIAKLKNVRAAALAKEAADKALPEFKDGDLPAVYAARAKVSEKFSIAAPIVRPLEGADALAQALLTAPEGKWLPQVYQVAEGAVVARPLSSTPPTDQEWQGLKSIFMQNLLQRKREDVATAFMRNLVDKAEIVSHPDALEQIRLN